MSATGKMMAFGGTATTTETRVTFPTAYKKGYPNANQTYPTPPAPGKFLKNIRIKCTDATNSLLVRINGGAQQVTLKPADPAMDLDPAIVHDLTVQSSAATAAWDAVAVVSA